MCKYCEKEEYSLIWQLSNKEIMQGFKRIDIYINKDNLIFGVRGKQQKEIFKSPKIAYCPMCGRTLKEAD